MQVRLGDTPPDVERIHADDLRDYEVASTCGIRYVVTAEYVSTLIVGNKRPLVAINCAVEKVLVNPASVA